MVGPPPTPASMVQFDATPTPAPTFYPHRCEETPHDRRCSERQAEGQPVGDPSYGELGSLFSCAPRSATTILRTTSAAKRGQEPFSSSISVRGWTAGDAVTSDGIVVNVSRGKNETGRQSIVSRYLFPPTESQRFFSGCSDRVLSNELPVRLSCRWLRWCVSRGELAR